MPAFARIVRGTLMFSCALFGFMQFKTAGSTRNPAVVYERTLEASSKVPPAVGRILARACRDCHSNDTQWPWYSHVAPMSWLVARDVDKGRRAFNVSEWTGGTARSGVAAAKLMAACADVKSGRMPLAPYRLMHPDARLTPEDINLFCGWTQSESQRLLAQGRLAQYSHSSAVTDLPAVDATHRPENSARSFNSGSN